MSIAWLFPGQGAQVVGMGRDLYGASAAARAVFARADAALGEPLSKLIFEGPEAALTLTENAQPAIVTVSTALLAALREQAPSLALPAFAAGHSLGEYSALVAAGALSFEDAVCTVRARGRAMQAAVAPGAGAMAAVMGLGEQELAPICAAAAQGEVLALANFNAPGQIVIAGSAAAVARAAAPISEAKGKMIPLKVSAPFHCALMLPAADEVARKLAAITVALPQFPVVANFTAAPGRTSAEIQGLLVSQVAGAVRWEQSVKWMYDAGVRTALEIGPGKVLAGLCKRIAKDLRVVAVCDFASLQAAALEFGTGN